MRTSRTLVTIVMTLSLEACPAPTHVEDADSDGGLIGDVERADVAFDGATDGPRPRDTGPEISLDSAFGECFVAITPRTGTVADTFTITGTGFLSTATATLRVVPEAGGTPVVDTTVPITGNMFTYMIQGSSLVAGNYLAEADDPTHVCSASGPFTVNP
jgi:hypothetical protein